MDVSSDYIRTWIINFTLVENQNTKANQLNIPSVLFVIATNQDAKISFLYFLERSAGSKVYILYNN